MNTQSEELNKKIDRTHPKIDEIISLIERMWGRKIVTEQDSADLDKELAEYYGKMISEFSNKPIISNSSVLDSSEPFVKM